MFQKIAVLGTGANGSCIAANLVDAGRDVMLIDQWPAHVEAMRKDGLRIAHANAADGELHVPVRAHHLCDIATFTEPFDVVLARHEGLRHALGLRADQAASET